MDQHVCVCEGRLLQCEVSQLPAVRRWVEVTGSCLRDGQGAPREYLYVLRDLTEQKRAEWRIRGQHEVTQILAESDSLAEAALRLLRSIGTGLDWSVGALWEIDRTGGSLRCTEMWECMPDTMVSFVETSFNMSFAPGIGLPGRVWASGRVLRIPDVEQDVNFPRVAKAVSDGLHGAVAFPIFHDGKILGVMEFFSPMVRHPDNDTLSAMSAFGIQIGAFAHRKQAQAREVSFGRILDDMLNEIYLFDAESLCFLHVNRGAQTNLGYSKEELLERTPLDLMPEFTGQSFATLIQYLYRGERPSLQFTAVHRRKDGSTYPVRVHLQCSLFGGHPTFVSVVLDMTEQCRAEQQRSAQYAVTRVLADASTIEEAMTGVLEAIGSSLNWDLGLLWQVNRQSYLLKSGHLWRKVPDLCPNMVEASQQEAFAFGIELPGRVWATEDVCWISDLSKETACLRQAAAEQDGLRGAYAFPIWLRGDVCAVMEFFCRESPTQETNLLLLLAEIGKQVGLFMERVEVESAFHENEARTRLMIDTALDGVITMDAEGLIREWNKQAEVMFGWSSQEAVGRVLSDTIIPEPYRAAHEQGLKRYIESGQGTVVNKLLEVMAIHRDGHEFPVEIAIAPLQFKGGNIFSAFVRDISARKNSERSQTAYAQKLE